MYYYDLRRLCIRNNYFTYGTNEQYDTMFEMAENGATPHDIALIIWICSNVPRNQKTLAKIENEVYEVYEKVRKIIEEE